MVNRLPAKAISRESMNFGGTMNLWVTCKSLVALFRMFLEDLIIVPFRALLCPRRPEEELLLLPLYLRRVYMVLVRA
jgi:hypothetical protein